MNLGAGRMRMPVPRSRVERCFGPIVLNVHRFPARNYFPPAASFSQFRPVYPADVLSMAFVFKGS